MPKKKVVSIISILSMLVIMIAIVAMSRRNSGVPDNVTIESSTEATSQEINTQIKANQKSSEQPSEELEQQAGSEVDSMAEQSEATVSAETTSSENVGVEVITEGESSLEKAMEKENINFNTTDEFIYDYQIYFYSLWHYEFKGRSEVMGVETMYDPASYKSPITVNMGYSELPIEYIRVYKDKESKSMKGTRMYDYWGPKVRSSIKESGYYEKQGKIKKLVMYDQMYICLDDLLDVMEINLIYSDDKKDVTFRYRDILVTYKMKNQQILLHTEKGTIYCEPDNGNYQFWISVTHGGGYRMIKNNEVIPFEWLIEETDLKKIHPEYVEGEVYVPLGMLVFFKEMYFSRPTDNTLYIDNTDTISYCERKTNFFLNEKRRKIR